MTRILTIVLGLAGVALLGSSSILELHRSLAGLGCLLLVLIVCVNQLHDEAKVQTELLAELTLAKKDN